MGNAGSNVTSAFQQPTGGVFDIQSIEYLDWFNSSFSTAQTKITFQQFKNDGANAVTIGWFVPVDQNTGDLLNSFSSPNNKFASLSEIQQIAQIATSLGLNVILKPQATDNTSSFPQNITVNNVGPSFDANTFLSGWSGYMQSVGQLAQQVGASMVVVGTENYGFDTADYRTQWINIINSVRSSYSGLLTYASIDPLDSPPYGVDEVSFWDKLDVIGDDGVYPLTTAANPTYQDVLASWYSNPISASSPVTPPVNVISALQALSQQYSKPIYFSEFFAPSIHGIVKNPALYNTPGQYSSDYQQQEWFFQSMFQAISQNNASDWFAGSNIWGYDNSQPGDENSEAFATYASTAQYGTNFDFRGKPAEQIIRAWYGATDYLAPGQSSFSGSIANDSIALYANPDQEQSTVSVILSGTIVDGQTPQIHVYADGKDLGAQALTNTPSTFVDSIGRVWTISETLNFSIPALTTINQLEIAFDGPTSVDGTPMGDNFLSVSVNGVTLSQSSYYPANGSPQSVAIGSGGQGDGGYTLVDTTPWNAYIAGIAEIGTTAEPIQVNGGGGTDTAHVLGAPTDYQIVTNPSGTVMLTENSGLDQNAVLTGITYLSFLDGAVRNLSTGTWSVNTAAATVAAYLPDYALMISAGMITGVNVTDSAANVASNLDTLQTLAAAHELGAITLTDSGTPTLNITKQQETSDTLALAAIVTPYSILLPLVDSLSTSQQLELIYIAYFNRAGDGGGFDFWSGQNQRAQYNGQSASLALTNIANSFAPQPETIALYSFLAPLASAGTINLNTAAAQAGLTAFVDTVYQNLFNRSADSAGQSYWVGQITSGAVGLGAAALAIANGATGTDATTVQNKITVALDFTSRTAAAGIGTTAPLASTFLAEASGVLSGVDGSSLNDTSVTAAEAATTAFIAHPASTQAASNDGAPDTLIISASNGVVDPASGDAMIQFLAATSNDSLVLHANSLAMVSGFDPTTDVLDLRWLLAESNIDMTGGVAALSDYVKIVDEGADALVRFDPAGQGGGGVIADLRGLGANVTSLATLIQQGAVRIS